jgi:hypothetical protein
MRKKVKKLLIQVVHKLFFWQCTYSTCILAMCVLNNKKENTSIMHKMICTFKVIVRPPSPMDHQAKLQTFKKKKRALELGRTSVLTWQTHPCPGHTHQVLCLGAVNPSSHMVEPPPPTYEVVRLVLHQVPT